MANREGARQRSHQHEARLCSCATGGCAENDSRRARKHQVVPEILHQLNLNTTSLPVWKPFVNPLKVLPPLHGAVGVRDADK